MQLSMFGNDKERRPRHLAAVLTVAAASLTVLGLSACGGNEKLTERTLRLVEGKQTETPSVDAPPRTQGRDEVTAGDRLVSSKEMLDESGDRRVGSVYLDCSAAAGDKPVAMCTGMFELEDGRLSFSESFDPSAEEEHIVAITGGTGDYEGATGTLVAGVDGSKRYEFQLFLP